VTEIDNDLLAGIIADVATELGVPEGHSAEVFLTLFASEVLTRYLERTSKPEQRQPVLIINRDKCEAIQ
jgi:hypothetical protein